MLSLCDQIRTDIDIHSTTSAASMPDSLQFSDTPIVETTAQSMDHSPATSSTVDAIVRLLTPANKSLRFNTISSRATVSGMSIASMDLISYLEPLPMDRLVLHEVRSVCAWPSTDRDQLLAVAHRDIHVVRQNVADLTRYMGIQYAHLAACAGDDSVPLMIVETFPRLPGSVRATLDSIQ